MGLTPISITTFDLPLSQNDASDKCHITFDKSMRLQIKHSSL